MVKTLLWSFGMREYNMTDKELIKALSEALVYYRLKGAGDGVSAEGLVVLLELKGTYTPKRVDELIKMANDRLE